jgi:hypothetical protein
MALNEGFTVHSGNPNSKHGGQGCLVSGGRPHEDCAGRWINFPTVQTEYAQSPFATICEYHLHRVLETYDDDDVLIETDAPELRPYSPVLREDTGMPAMGFAGVPGDPDGAARERVEV